MHFLFRYKWLCLRQRRQSNENRCGRQAPIFNARLVLISILIVLRADRVGAGWDRSNNNL